MAAAAAGCRCGTAAARAAAAPAAGRRPAAAAPPAAASWLNRTRRRCTASETLHERRDPVNLCSGSKWPCCMGKVWWRGGTWGEGAMVVMKRACERACASAGMTHRSRPRSSLRSAQRLPAGRTYEACRQSAPAPPRRAVGTHGSCRGGGTGGGNAKRWMRPLQGRAPSQRCNLGPLLFPLRCPLPCSLPCIPRQLAPAEERLQAQRAVGAAGHLRRQRRL